MGKKLEIELPGQQIILECIDPMPGIIWTFDDDPYPWFVAIEKVFLSNEEIDASVASFSYRLE